MRPALLTSRSTGGRLRRAALDRLAGGQVHARRGRTSRAPPAARRAGREALRVADAAEQQARAGVWPAPPRSRGRCRGSSRSRARSVPVGPWRSTASSTMYARDAGEPIILLHPLGAELVVWEPVMERLAAERDVIAVDLPGFGPSPPLPAARRRRRRRWPRPWSAFLDSIGLDRVHVAGNSLGGWVALELAQVRARAVGHRALRSGLLEAAARHARRAGSTPAGRALLPRAAGARADATRPACAAARLHRAPGAGAATRGRPAGARHT